MRLQILSKLIWVICICVPVLGLSGGQRSGQPTSILRLYTNRPKQLTAIQFSDSETGKVLNTVDLQKYNPFRYDLPKKYIDTTRVSYKVSDPNELSPEILRQYHAGYGRYRQRIESLDSWVQIFRSPQYHWVTVLYTISLYGKKGALVEQSRLIIFTGTGDLYWELPVLQGHISYKLKYSLDDSLLAYAYYTAVGVPTKVPEGIQILNLFAKKLCIDYHAPHHQFITGDPRRSEGDKFYISTENFRNHSSIVFVFNCEENTRVRSRNFTWQTSQNILAVSWKGIKYRKANGDTVYRPFHMYSKIRGR